MNRHETVNQVTFPGGRSFHFSDPIAVWPDQAQSTVGTFPIIFQRSCPERGLPFVVTMKRRHGTMETINENQSATGHPVVSREEWLGKRIELLQKEKELTRLKDDFARQLRDLPWVRIKKDYRFQTPDGEKTLGELFGGKSQLVIQHFMLGPGWEEGCKSCSFMADHTDGMLPHLAARDVTMLAVSRAPLSEIEAFKKRMGWRFPWVSSNGSDFNFDFHVSFTEEEIAGGKVDYNYTLQEFGSTEAPGISVFQKDADGEIFHTYSAFGRGVEQVVGTYSVLDLVPKGRDEDGLEFTMAWVRHHDRYEECCAAKSHCCSERGQE
jgi:predicted dithiol-disulfide oxidoreductase (DUF899 family)